MWTNKRTTGRLIIFKKLKGYQVPILQRTFTWYLIIQVVKSFMNSKNSNLKNNNLLQFRQLETINLL